ncbi:NAD-dependent epimerase/dehydratase family protein [Propionibacteriaceae bacterium Y2011]
MKVLVAGATGAIGRALVPQLVAAGHSVLGLTRHESAAAGLTATGATPIVADLLDEAGLRRALDGHGADAVIHQATAITGLPMRHRDLFATDELRSWGTRNLVRAATELGAHRIITQSFFLGYGWRDLGPDLIDETAPFGVTEGGPFDPHLRALRENEDLVLGEAGISLRYGMFYGSDASTAQMVKLARRGWMPAPRPSSSVSLVHLTDAAAATVAAMTAGRPGQAYNIADDHPLGMDELIDTVAETLGARRPLRLPAALLRPTPYLYALMAGVRVKLDTRLARAELGWQPQFRTCRAGLTDLMSAVTA